MPNASEPEHRPFVYELILLDVSYRRREGEIPKAEEYHTRVPSLSNPGQLDHRTISEAVAAMASARVLLSCYGFPSLRGALLTSRAVPISSVRGISESSAGSNLTL